MAKTNKPTLIQISILLNIRDTGSTGPTSNWSAICSLMRKGLLVEQPVWTVTAAGLELLTKEGL